ncbi:NAD-dependent epimerase/dehydratase family protein [Halobacteriales archaeon Cl-PHB]
MELSDRRILVTGGAGFVGSHLCHRLVPENDVVIVDNGSNGDRDWLPEDVEFVAGDLREPAVVREAITEDVDVVFHFAADKDAARDDMDQFRVNNTLTENVIERMDEVGVSNLAFTSSSTVYGEAPMPTPEDFGPLEPISVYGASKLAEEGLISVYAHSHGIQAWAFRFANIVGPRLQPGSVITDFIEKLRDDPESLTILGDGRQEKSYMYVDDCIEAMCTVVEQAEQPFNVFNLGTESTTSVTTIADIIAEEMGLDPEYEFTGGDRGWTGDVPKMRLDVEKLAGLGFSPDHESDEAVRRATQELLAEY